MFYTDNRVGRLVELRIAWPLRPEEIADLIRRHRLNLEKINGKIVSVVDLRKSHVLPAEAAEQFIRMMAANTDTLERTGILIPESAVFGLQAERAIHEAGGLTKRRIFRDPAELRLWLGEVLTREEKLRLRDFLMEADPAA